jgi:hypothetical protein
MMDRIISQEQELMTKLQNIVQATIVVSAPDASKKINQII